MNIRLRRPRQLGPCPNGWAKQFRDQSAASTSTAGADRSGAALCETKKIRAIAPNYVNVHK